MKLVLAYLYGPASLLGLRSFLVNQPLHSFRNLERRLNNACAMPSPCFQLQEPSSFQYQAMRCLGPIHLELPMPFVSSFRDVALCELRA